MLKLRLTDAPGHMTPSVAFVWLLQHYMRAALQPGVTTQVSMSKRDYYHPAFTVAHNRMLERLRLGTRTSLESTGGAVESPPNPGPGIGRYGRSSVVLVGDKTSQSGRWRVAWPFVSGLRTGCSAWLAEALEAQRVPEASLYWVNSEHRGAALSAEFLVEMQPRGVVALGKNAADWCVRNNVAHRHVHHPAYWCKYRRNEHYILGRTVRALLNG